MKGEGRLDCGGCGRPPDGGNEEGALLPITSCMEGSDCLFALISWSSEVRRDSTGEIMPGAEGGVWPWPWCWFWF